MIGAEHAAEAAPFGLAAGVEGYDVGWVADWLYGDAALPPAPLPPRELPEPRRWLPAPGAPAYVRRLAPPPREVRPARQLALL